MLTYLRERSAFSLSQQSVLCGAYMMIFKYCSSCIALYRIFTRFRLIKRCIIYDWQALLHRKIYFPTYKKMQMAVG